MTKPYTPRHDGDSGSASPTPRVVDSTPHRGGTGSDQERRSVIAVISAHRFEVSLRAALLVMTVLPIVLPSHDVAVLLDDGLGRLGAPVALAGILIAMIVFLPESITALRAAMGR